MFNSPLATFGNVEHFNFWQVAKRSVTAEVPYVRNVRSPEATTGTSAAVGQLGNCRFEASCLESHVTQWLVALWFAWP